MAAADVISPQNVLDRVTSLPLVSSAYALVSGVYCAAKDNHPYVRSVCEAAEQGVRAVTSVALTTASPFVAKLEPQIAIANHLACQGLDRIEKTLPILQQPSEQLLSSAKDAVSTAKDVVTDRVYNAKAAVSDTLTGAVGRTLGAVQGGVEKTKTAVGGSVSTALESRAAQMVSSGVDTALSASESLVERYLSVTEDEPATEPEANAAGGSDGVPSYYVRLGSLSAKLRKRAYTRAVSKIQDGRRRSMEFISELHSAVDVIEYGRRNIGEANQMVNDTLSTVAAWKSNGPGQEKGHDAEVIESHTLALARSLTQQLQTTCVVLVSGLQGLPSHVHQEALSLGRSASQVYADFSHAGALGDLPDSVLASSRAQLGKITTSLDHVMDYLVNNTPLNWLVGPFYPRMAPELRHAPAPRPHGEGPGAVEMRPLPSQHHE